MTADSARRLAESAAEAGIVLALAALPSAWHSLDTARGIVLAAMLVVLTAATYALHAVTFDCLRLTSDQGKSRFQTTQREE